MHSPRCTAICIGGAAIAAPPKILACLRKSMHQEVEKRVIAELDKDLTNQPINEITALMSSGQEEEER